MLLFPGSTVLCDVLLFYSFVNASPVLDARNQALLSEESVVRRESQNCVVIWAPFIEPQHILLNRESCCEACKDGVTVVSQG